MTYNQYRMIFYVSFTAFAIMLIASIVILIVLEIPKVIRCTYRKICPERNCSNCTKADSGTY